MLKDLFIFAGEASGDLHGAHLIQSLRSQHPSLKIWGVGGPKMRSEGLRCLMGMEEFQVMGFQDVLLALPKLFKHLRMIVAEILKNNPQTVLLIDYAEFNMLLSKRLRKKGYTGKIIHYICPSVWAWRKGRIYTLAKTLDLLLVIFPFEPACFKETSLRVEYIGNPLTQQILSQKVLSDHFQKINIALFPGSRRSEITLNLAAQLQTAELLKRSYPEITFGLSIAQERLRPLIEEIVQKSTLRLNRDLFLIPSGEAYALMQNCDAALATSGTVTLELALHHIPTVVMYRLSFINWFVAKFLIRLHLPFYCIVNIIAQKTVFPELIYEKFSAHHAAEELAKLYRHGTERESCIAACQAVQQQLSSAISPSDRAAEIMNGLLNT
jgi:lipid-A-disaccharide synthase